MLVFFLLIIFTITHVVIWYSSNLQFIVNDQTKALLFAILLGIPASIGAFYATKIGHSHFNSLWTVRLLGFGSSYLVFPFMTYFYLNESPFTPKTMTCIFLSFVIMAIQIGWRNT
mgnify:FL=1